MVKSQLLTNVRSINVRNKGEPIYQDASWKKGYVQERQGDASWQSNRLKRLETAQGYANVNISMPYIPPNKSVLNLRLVHQNNVWDYVTKMNEATLEAKRFNYYDPVNQAPPQRGILYRSNDYGITY